MSRLKKAIPTLFFLFTIALATIGVLALVIPKAEPLLHMDIGEDNVEQSNLKQKIHYTALGDSLTEGVGDSTKQGGFVPILANAVSEKFNLTSIEVENFGVNGERSDQILKRVKNDEDLIKNLKNADFITLTVGGNDLMKVIQNNIFGLSEKSFATPQKKYEKNVATLLEQIRALNPNAPIYVLGIYNPFYLNFPEITEMQTIVNNWNEGTKTVVNEEGNSFFIPINDLLYQGVNQEVGIGTDQSEGYEASTADSLKEVKNNALYDGDHFHPNNLGYQIMANAVRDKLVITKYQWLYKEEGK